MKATHIPARLTLLGLVILGGCAIPPSARSRPQNPFRPIHVYRKASSLFTFTNQTGHPIKVYGFDSPDDGVMQIRFTEYQFLTPKGWQNLKIGYCGTGAETFLLQPGRSYQIHEWLNAYATSPDETAGATIGRISLPTDPNQPKIWSAPFRIPGRK